MIFIHPDFMPEKGIGLTMRLRLTGFLSLVTLMFILCGCSLLFPKPDESGDTDSENKIPGITSPQKTSDGLFRIRFSSDDTLNPYTVKTRGNLELHTLLYEGLTRLDSSWTAVNSLAESIDDTEPLKITAVLRSDARFSDGSIVTANDVENSFSYAKSSKWFSPLVANLKSVTVINQRTLEFQLIRNEPNPTACLSFPVLRSTDGDTPLGSGPYVFKTGDIPMLIANTVRNPDPIIRSIGLSDSQEGDALLYTLESGFINYFYSNLSDGLTPRTLSPHTAVPMNHLIYIGINSKRAALADEKVRAAISVSLNRSRIAGDVYGGWAEAATSPFNSKWSGSSGINIFDVNDNINAAVAHLDELGYNSGNKNQLTLELLVANGSESRQAAADAIAEQLGKSGIAVTVVPLALNTMVARLKSGGFDLYLGEVKLSAGMSLDCMLRSGNECAYGVDSGFVSVYDQLLSGETAMREFLEEFGRQLPFIPVCWRNGLAAYSRSLNGVSPTAFDVFYGIEGWNFS